MNLLFASSFREERAFQENETSNNARQMNSTLFHQRLTGAGRLRGHRSASSLPERL
jgi:hypothetical protein